MMDPCSICYQELSKANNCVVHPCQHEFCKECIYKLKASNKFKFKCPLCRANIVSVFNVSMKKLTFLSKIPSFDLPWEKKILLIRKNFWNLRQKAEKFQLIQTAKCRNNFWNKELFLNLFLEVSKNSYWEK